MLQETIGDTGNLIVYCGDENLINFLRHYTRIDGFQIRDFEESKKFIRKGNGSSTLNLFNLISTIRGLSESKKIKGVYLVGHLNCRLFNEDEPPLSPDNDRNRQVEYLKKLKTYLLLALKIEVPFGIFICETK